MASTPPVHDRPRAGALGAALLRGGGAVYCRSTSVQAEPATTRDSPPLPEREANALSAAMVMPARLLQEHYEKNRDFHHLCRLFGASGAAMGRRLHRVI